VIAASIAGCALGMYFATVGDFETVGLNARDVAVTNALMIVE
jgi:hypothetical protein